MTNFTVTIYEKGNRKIIYDNIWKIESNIGHLRFFDNDNNIMREYKKDIEKLEIIYNK